MMTLMARPGTGGSLRPDAGPSPPAAAPTIAFLGLDPFNRTELASLRDAERYRFVDLLRFHGELRPDHGPIDFDRLLATAEARLAALDRPADAIVTFWDFPASALVGVLRNRRGLPGPSNEAIAMCEHKLWSRLEQRAVVPDLVPAFCGFDPFATDPLAMIDLAFPFWIKPVKAHSSHLGFKIRNRADFDRHLPVIRAEIDHFATAFDQYLRHVDLPDAIRPITGRWCVAEAIISAGRQCTLEGYVHRGEVVVYGTVDSLRSGKHRSCLTRYQYPSTLPRRVQGRMIAATHTVLTRFGYDAAPFNIEFFWNPRTDRIWLLEVNARLSKSHCPLFRLVDGASHQQVLVDLGLGRRPSMPHRQGEFRLAGKFMLRTFEDGMVGRLPTPQEIAAVQDLYPEMRVRLMTEPGARLTHMKYQDSYSFELAEIFLGADSQKTLLAKYADCLERLPFAVDPIDGGRP